MPLEQIYARGRTGDTEFKRTIAVIVQRGTINDIARIGSPDLLSLRVGPIESNDPKVAITACTAAMAIGNPEFGRRYRDDL